MEERTIRGADAAWLAERHPDWKGLQSIVAVTVRRTIKRTGMVSIEIRLFISSPPDPVCLAAAVRAHWSVENNLHWVLDVAFREDECRTRKDHSAQPRHDPPRRAQHAPARAFQEIVQAQAPQSPHEPPTTAKLSSPLTIHDLALFLGIENMVGTDLMSYCWKVLSRSMAAGNPLSETVKFASFSLP
ncbi:ISAs1 family transposase [Mesorhizobium sp. B2-4-14]|nr:ISAs1 family transposase [Mesorhizobium sp. B2-4-14]